MESRSAVRRREPNDVSVSPVFVEGTIAATFRFIGLSIRVLEMQWQARQTISALVRLSGIAMRCRKRRGQLRNVVQQVDRGRRPERPDDPAAAFSVSSYDAATQMRATRGFQLIRLVRGRRFKDQFIGIARRQVGIGSSVPPVR